VGKNYTLVFFFNFFILQLLTWHFDALMKFTNVLNCDTLVNGNVLQFDTLVNS
jgi:hypothetical protein